MSSNHRIVRVASNHAAPIRKASTKLTEKTLFVLVLEQAARIGIFCTHGDDLPHVVIAWIYGVDLVSDTAQTKGDQILHALGVIYGRDIG